MKNREGQKIVPVEKFLLFKEIQQVFGSYEEPFIASFENDDKKPKNDSGKNRFDGGIKA